eukprot:GFYU01006260.1.p1 GENE.GFYU01006260.1~~GFYU01006260.1.p1  ORF type:complete len:506 (+),score=160.84 GFYU01006260.1:151-1668(+)
MDQLVQGIDSLDLNSFKAVAEPLGQKAIVNVDGDGNLALHHACDRDPAQQTQVYPIVKWLIEQGADVNKKNNHGWTPLHFAANRGSDKLVKLLARGGANLVAREAAQHCTPVHLAALRGHKKCVLELTEQFLSMPSKDGDTPLHWSVSKGHDEVVETLIHRGASVNVQNKEGNTALHLASKKDRETIASKLISSGATLTVENAKKQTPVEVAASDRLKSVLESESSRSVESSARPRFPEKQEWAIEYNTLTFSKKIGEGAIGKVYTGDWRGTPVAIKKLKVAKLSPEARTEFYEEVAMMKALRHPNVVLFMGVTIDPLCIVTELLDRGSLFNTLTSASVKISGSDVVRMALDAARGMNYLHTFDPPVLHRDLKSLNLLVDKSLNVKVADFGLSRVKTLTTTMTGQIGTFHWMAPEVIAGEKYSEKADVYSYGIVLSELVTREPPYGEMNQMQIAYGVLNRDLRPNLPKNLNPDYRRLCQQCWHNDPRERPSFAEIIKTLQLIKTI